jgi:hypothetical protein
MDIRDFETVGKGFNGRRLKVLARIQAHHAGLAAFRARKLFHSSTLAEIIRGFALFVGPVPDSNPIRPLLFSNWAH